MGTRWFDDRLTLAEFLHWMEETSRITTALDAARVVEKPHHHQTDYDEWRADQADEAMESLVDARREEAA